MKNKEKIIGSAIILAVLVLFLIVGYFISRPKNTDNNDIFVETDSGNAESTNSSKNSESNKTDTLFVEIKGEVKNPGVYELKKGSRIKDLVKISGGFTQDADTDKIILVKTLKDEDCIMVLKKGQNTSQSSGTVSSISGSGKININTATLEELQKVPGIGPTTAQKIIDYREKNGDFKTIDDLKKIGRIGDKTIAKFKDYIDVR